MSEFTIRMRPNGPFVIEGTAKVLDSNGQPFATNPDKPVIALCRCGQSEKKPFCDGAHNRCGFVSDEQAALPPA